MTSMGGSGQNKSGDVRTGWGRSKQVRRVVLGQSDNRFLRHNNVDIKIRVNRNIQDFTGLLRTLQDFTE